MIEVQNIAENVPITSSLIKRKYGIGKINKCKSEKAKSLESLDFTRVSDTTSVFLYMYSNKRLKQWNQPFLADKTENI